LVLPKDFRIEKNKRYKVQEMFQQHWMNENIIIYYNLNIKNCIDEYFEALLNYMGSIYLELHVFFSIYLSYCLWHHNLMKIYGFLSFTVFCWF
jgi:hypothetical protein